MQGMNAEAAEGKSGKAKEAAATAKAGEDVAVLKTNMGTIVFRFFEKDAPIHVANDSTGPVSPNSSMVGERSTVLQRLP